MLQYSEEDVPSQTGRTFLITGANTGIGFEAAKVLAQKGARVLLGCRNEEKARTAIERIRSVSESADVDWLPMDLSSLDSIRSASEEAMQEARLDVLVNNAGVMMPPYTRTTDGFELQFGVNHLGHFALTGLLMPKLLSTADSRIVNVSSIAHRGGRIDFDDPQATQNYNAAERYRMSKLANLLFTYSLQKRLDENQKASMAVACHPGIAETDLSRHMPGWVNLLAPVLRPFFNSALEGALPTLEAATRKDVVGGSYFGPQKRGETARSSGPARIEPRGLDGETAERLWSLSAELTGVTYSFSQD